MGRQSRKAWQERLWPRDDRGYACDPTLRGSYTEQAVGAIRSNLSSKVDWREMGFGLVLQLPIIAGFVLANVYLPPRLWGLDRVLVVLGCTIAAAFAWGQVVYRLPFMRAMTERMVHRNWRAQLAKREGKGACLACGYTLDGATIAEDGCLQCPECGAAWRAERVRGDGPALPDV